MKDNEKARQTTDTKTEKMKADNESSLKESKSDAERSQEKKEDTSDYVIIESGLGIDE